MGNASLQIYAALHISCKLEVDGIMNVTDKQLATEGEKCCVCCINRINRPENGFWIQLTVLGRHFYYQLIGSGRDRSLGTGGCVAGCLCICRWKFLCRIEDRSEEIPCI